jgi:aconitate hydratase
MDGKPVFLADLWPSRSEILEVAQRVVQPEVFSQSYANVYAGSSAWNQIESPDSALYPWNPDSTYIQEAPFLQIAQSAAPLRDARCLAVFGDSITTDHISPAGSIPEASPAGRYLIEHGVPVSEFNSYGARRGNDRVMARGTFANIRIKNLMLPGVEGGVALHLPDGQQMPLFAAAELYRSENVPLIILAGKEYGTGSSRDWAAKGPLLLGVRAVIAESFERIHRSNLVGMGILPLQFMPGENVQSLGLSGREQFNISFLSEGLRPKAILAVTALDEAGQEKHFNVNARINSAQEIELLQNGGLLPYVLKRL